MSYVGSQFHGVKFQNVADPGNKLASVKDVFWDKGNLKGRSAVHQDLLALVKDHPTRGRDPSNPDSVILGKLSEFLSLGDLEVIDT